ncbi:MAG: TIGR02300 family protein [Hyphomicrobiaceae bacterium]|jgi:uncharacterized protein (TIGR02300 family)
MSTKAARGTKRTCQNPQCGSRFYDLNREPITCPICETVYRIASAPGGVVEDKARKAKKPEFVDEGVPAVVPEVEGAEELVDIEATEEPIAAEADETFLEEEEEEGGDMSNIIGGPVAEGDEEP